MPITKMIDLDLKDKRVLIREDFNVPIKDGVILCDTRIKAALTTIKLAHTAGAKIILVSHLGRPKAGQFNEIYSLAPVAKRLTQLLNLPVKLIGNWQNGLELAPGEIVLLENIRFQKGEKENDEDLSKKLSSLADIYVMDAFGTAHRAHASTYGIAQFVPIACAGPLLTAELKALGKIFEDPAKPLVAIVGGAKVSTKVGVLKSIIENFDHLIVGGGIANTFLAAVGAPIGKSLYEQSLVDTTKELLALAKKQGTQILLPVDVVVAKELSKDAIATTRLVDEVEDNDLILDVGPKTQTLCENVLQNAKTIIWNGPVGVFEFEQFSEGTKAISLAVAKSNAFSIAGGGETLAAIEQFKVADGISYISTGGGAFLEFLQNKTLPAIGTLKTC